MKKKEARKDESSDYSDNETDNDIMVSQPITSTEQQKVVKRKSITPKKRKSRKSRKSKKNSKETDSPPTKRKKTTVLDSISIDDDEDLGVGGIEIVEKEEIPRSEIEINTIDGHICEMKAPVERFAEPCEEHKVRDIDERHVKSLYNELLTNPQNHIHRAPFIINIVPSKDKVGENEEEVNKIVERFRKLREKAKINATKHSPTLLSEIQQGMIDLFSEALFHQIYVMEVIGGNHSRSCYQRLITELADDAFGLSKALKERQITPFTGINQYSSEGKILKHCVDSKIFFDLCKFHFLNKI